MDLSNGSFIGNSGQVIYEDITKHDILNLSQIEQIYYVFNVGYSKSGNLTITTKVNNKPKCFRLPSN